MWGIGLETSINTLDTTTHKCIRSTGLLANRFKTDKYQLLYKQLSSWYGKFYVEYIKVGVDSVRQFIGGNFHTEKLGFDTLFLCSDETLEETGHTIRVLIELVGLPLILHSDNHNKFKEGNIERLLRNVGFVPTYKQPYLPW